MKNLLVRTFIKDYKNVKDVKVRNQYNLLASIIGFISNIILFIIKIIVGIYSGSVSIIADSFNNISDVGTSVTLFIVSKLSSKPADEEHPFGHGRIEYISCLIISFFIIMIGFDFIKLSIHKILIPTNIKSNIFIILILIATIIIKLCMSLFYKKLSYTIDSINLRALSVDSFSDAIATLGTIFSITINYIFAYSIDGYIGVLVALFIIYSGYSIAKETINLLIGKAVEPEIIEKIKKIILDHDLIIGVHKIVVHSYGPTKYIGSVHAEINKDCNIIQAHNCVDQAENKIKKQLGIDIVIHVDPL